MDVTQSRTRTAAQRQADYRARKAGMYAKRVNIWLPEDAGRALDRLAAHRGVTRSQLIAGLVADADKAAVAGIPDDGLDRYYGG